jgi:hypothetical protein
VLLGCGSVAMKITVPSFLAKAALIQHGFDLRVSRMAGDDLISGIQDLLVCRFCTNTHPKNIGCLVGLNDIWANIMKQI